MQQTTLGATIRSLRKQHNMTQADLAEKLGVTDKAVSKWERGKSYPDIGHFPKLAGIFGMSIDEMVKDCTNEEQPAKLLQIFKLSHDIRTPLNIILGCADLAAEHVDDKEKLLRYLKNIRISGEYLLDVIENVQNGEYADLEDLLEQMISKESGMHRCLVQDASAPVGQGTPGAVGADPPASDGPVASATTGPPSRGAADSTSQADEFKGFSDGPAADFKDFDFSGKRILLAEDMAINREITRELLKKTGAEVEFAEDGQVCVEKIAASPPGTYDLVLMDIKMPNMDGIQATREIRKLPDCRKASIPIIAMTANVYERDRKEAFEAGMNDFTEKPIVTHTLLATLKQHL